MPLGSSGGLNNAGSGRRVGGGLGQRSAVFRPGVMRPSSGGAVFRQNVPASGAVFKPGVGIKPAPKMGVSPIKPPTAGAPAAGSDALAALLKEFGVSAPSSGPAIDPRDADYFLQVGTHRHDLANAIAPFQSEVAKLEAGGRALYNEGLGRLKRDLNTGNQQLLGSLAARGMLQSGLHDAGAARLGSDFQDAERELDSRLGGRAIAEQQRLMEDARREQGNLLLAALGKIAADRQAKIADADGSGAPAVTRSIAKGSGRGFFFESGGSWWYANPKVGRAEKVDKSVVKKDRVGSAPKGFK